MITQHLQSESDFFFSVFFLLHSEMLEMDMEAHEATLEHERALTELTELTEMSLDQYIPDVAPRTHRSTHHSTSHSHSLRHMVAFSDD